MSSPDRILRYQAGMHLRHIPEVRGVLRAVSNDPQALAERIKEFDKVCKDWNVLLKKPNMSNPRYYGVHYNSWGIKDRHSIHRLASIKSLTASNRTPDMYTQLADKLAKGEGMTTISNPLGLATGLMVEGYGSNLAAKRGSEVDRVFALGFGEMLITYRLGSVLLDDTFRWMAVNRKDFPLRIRDYLNTTKGLPLSFAEQASMESDFEIRQAKTQQLHDEARALLESSGITIVSSMYRAKAPERVQVKSKYNKRPLLDLYGIRFVIDQSNIMNAIDVVACQWKQPEAYPWGISGLGDFTEPKRLPYKYSDPNYRAMHLRVIFDSSHIAEFQFVTPEQYRINLLAEPGYHARRALYEVSR